MLAAIAAALDRHALPCCLGELADHLGCDGLLPRGRGHLGVVEVIKNLAHITKKGTADFRQPRAVPWFSEEEVRSQFFFDVADMPRDDGLIGVQPQRRPAEIRFSPLPLQSGEDGEGPQLPTSRSWSHQRFSIRSSA